MSSSVIESVAALDGVDPVDLDERLNDVLDPDALDALFGAWDDDPDDRRGSVAFTYCGHRVVARSTGEVTVESTD